MVAKESGEGMEEEASKMRISDRLGTHLTHGSGLPWPTFSSSLDIIGNKNNNAD